VRHLPGDPALGHPICPDCYDYPRAVVWNALASRLWRRTTIYLRRTLARQAGLTVAQFRAMTRVSYAKVAEYQARGAVHFHVLVRLDGPDHTRPPAWASTELLAAALRETAATVRLPGPVLDGQPVEVGWGEQLDLRPITNGQAGEGSAGRVAGYVAKYTTKATEHLGLDTPIRSLRQVEELDAPAHIRALARACWTLGARPELAALGLRRWAHMLGYGGHATTKSHTYSTTFRALRAARRAYVARRRHGSTVPLDRDGRLQPPAGTVAVAGWEYAGRGYTTPADAWLAATMATDHHQARQLAREELSRAA
jgi:hypothetical protein